MLYESEIHNIEEISFDKIIELNNHFAEPYQYGSSLYASLNHGTSILTEEEQLFAYIAGYGKIHQAKINEVLPKVNLQEFQNTDIQIIDWGCGQGLGTLCLFDYFNQKNISLNFVKRVVLIEPSEIALERARIHVGAYLHDNERIFLVKKMLLLL